jgi:hypothetical protein
MTLLVGEQSTTARGPLITGGSLWYPQGGYVAEESGEVETLNVYVTNPAFGASVEFRLALYDNAGNKLGEGVGDVSVLGAAGNIPVSVTPFNVVQGQTYFPVITVEGTSGDFYMQIADDNVEWMCWRKDHAYGALPSTIANFGTEEDSISAGRPAIWADGTVDGGGDPAPDITDVDEDNTLSADQTNVEIDGADFDTASVDIEQGSTSVAQSIDSQNATAIVFDVVFDAGAGPHLKHGAATLRVTNGDDQDDTQAITITPTAGTDYVDIVDPDEEAENRLEGDPDLETGDQVQWGDVVGTDVDETDVTVNADGSWEASEDVESFDFRIWDANDSTWGAWATQTVNADDETPDAFAFTDVTDAVPGEQYTSNTITVTGLGDGVTVDVAISGGSGEYSKNGGAFTSDAGAAQNGDTFAVRVTASSSYETAVETTLSIGTEDDTYSVTTQANAAPVFGANIGKITLVVGVEMTPRDFSGRFTDLEELTFTLEGTPPEGVELSSAGVLSGTPTETGEFTGLLIRADDGALTADSNEFTIEVLAESESRSDIVLARRRGRR